jgi:hypothetical protein
MVDQSTTLIWVQDSLQPAQLALSDVILFDMFPIVRDDLMKQAEEGDQLVLVSRIVCTYGRVSPTDSTAGVDLLPM